MSVRSGLRRTGIALARRGWLGAADGPLRTAARGFDRALDSLGRASGNRSTVAGLWDRLASDEFIRDLERHSWTGFTAIHLNHNRLITGRRDVYWVDWLRERYFNDGLARDVLSLGCGAGHLDRILGQRGFVMRSFTGLDISPAATARARELADAVALAPVVSYQTVDLNTCDLPRQRYDFIYFFQSLHHIDALERLLDQCREALRPGGLLLVAEFVGPSRFQWTREQMDHANEQLATLPPALRRDVADGSIKSRAHRPTVAEMIAMDPSEAVRSADIEGALKERFTVVGEWSWGGTVNYLVFQNIASNFDQADPAHMDHVERLIAYENAVIAAGDLPSDFKVFLATGA